MLIQYVLSETELWKALPISWGVHGAPTHVQCSRNEMQLYDFRNNWYAQFFAMTALCHCESGH